MQALVDVILPVFLVLGAGYLVRWRGLLDDQAIDALIRFSQGFALPCLLFRGVATLDMGAAFDLRLLIAFYAGAVAAFAAGVAGARVLFGRPWEDSIAIGFCCLFSNSLLLGLPITERAYGTGALESNYVILSVHAPICYGIGVTAMEIVRNRGATHFGTLRAILRAMFRNSLVIGIALGALVNLSNVTLPRVLDDALLLIVRAALPTALFGLGGVLYRYRPEGDMRVILFVCVMALGLHPAVTWTIGTLTGLDAGPFRSAVITAAMAPGVNAYMFANMYGVARRVAASSVLIATILTIGTASLWLSHLP